MNFARTSPPLLRCGTLETEFFKQSSTYLHFIVDRILAIVIYRDPVRMADNIQQQRNSMTTNEITSNVASVAFSTTFQMSVP